MTNFRRLAFSLRADRASVDRADHRREIGKPEPLRQTLQGCWSRRITGEHRMVYQVIKGELLIMQLRYHY